MRKLLIISVTTAVVLVMGVLAVSRDRVSMSDDTQRMRVAASFYPLVEFSKQVGGDKVEVISMVPPGVEPHDFEPTAQDIAKIYSAQVFVYNGGGLDPWAEKIAPELTERGMVVVKMTEHFELMRGNEHEEEGTDKHAGEDLDPHIWLDPVLAKKQVGIIRDALKNADAKNAREFESNAEDYQAVLSQLDLRYREGLVSCQIRDAVASHAAFGYLAKRYDLNVVNIAGLSPEEEPSPKRMAEIAEFARDKNIRYIFFETLVPAKLAETIASEIGARTLVFSSLEGLTEAELSAGKNYVSVMEENLNNLRLALRCQ